MHTITRLSAAAVALLLGTSCQLISVAPEGSPRVELEVAVNLDDSYTRQLQVPADDLARAVAEVVLDRADVGLRFYPVLSQDYGPDDDRPEYLMTVSVHDLRVRLGQVTEHQGGADVVVETFVEELDCDVSTTLTKRRSHGPALVVGRGRGRGSEPVGRDAEEGDAEYQVTRKAAGAPALSVSRADLLRATDQGLGQSIAALIAPIERELSLPPSPQHAAAAPAK